MTRLPVDDRRVQRTKRSLRRAITSLVHDKPLNAIAVKEILARAGVGRSAFYAHFHDKADLAASAIRETLYECEQRSPETNGPEDILRFSRPLLEHIMTTLSCRSAVGRQEAHVALHAVVGDVLASHITRRISILGQRRKRRSQCTPLSVSYELLGAHVAASFIRVVEWSVQQNGAASTAQADAVFALLTLPSLQQIFAE